MSTDSERFFNTNRAPRAALKRGDGDGNRDSKKVKSSGIPTQNDESGALGNLQASGYAPKKTSREPLKAINEQVKDLAKTQQEKSKQFNTKENIPPSKAGNKRTSTTDREDTKKIKLTQITEECSSSPPQSPDVKSMAQRAEEDSYSPPQSPDVKSISKRAEEDSYSPPQSPDVKSIAQRAEEKAEALGFNSPNGRSLKTLAMLGKHGENAGSSFHEGEGISSMFKHGAAMCSVTTPSKAHNKGTYVETSWYIMEKIGEIAVHAKHFFPSGLKGTQVLGINSYKQIASSLKVLLTKSTDKDIVTTIWEILRDEELSLAHKYDQSELMLLGRTSYLLFAIETNRDKASIIVNAMFLELVENGILSIKDIASLPMSINYAKGIHRHLSVILEKSGPAPRKGDPDIKSSDTREILDRYCNIVEKWGDFKFPGQKVNLKEDIQLISDEITDAMERWYNIEQKLVIYDKSQYASASQDTYLEYDTQVTGDVDFA